ncbi:transporter substrate-binding domain-containing protein, partial [Simonsiella muelleri]
MNTRLISVLISGLFLVACQKEAPNSPASTENKTLAAETGMISPQVDVAPRPAFNANWKTYTFATEPNYPPLEYRNKNTEIIGFETDILYAVAESAQFNV